MHILDVLPRSFPNAPGGHEHRQPAGASLLPCCDGWRCRCGLNMAGLQVHVAHKGMACDCKAALLCLHKCASLLLQMPAAGIEAAVAERRAVRERMLAQQPKACGWAVNAVRAAAANRTCDCTGLQYRQSNAALEQFLLTALHSCRRPAPHHTHRRTLCLCTLARQLIEQTRACQTLELELPTPHRRCSARGMQKTCPSCAKSWRMRPCRWRRQRPARRAAVRGSKSRRWRSTCRRTPIRCGGRLGGALSATALLFCGTGHACVECMAHWLTAGHACTAQWRRPTGGLLCSDLPLRIRPALHRSCRAMWPAQPARIRTSGKAGCTTPRRRSRCLAS